MAEERPHSVGYSPPMAYAAVNGLDMYYEVHGDGPPLLLLHGGVKLGSTKPSRFRRLLPSLARRRETLARRYRTSEGHVAGRAELHG